MWAGCFSAAVIYDSSFILLLTSFSTSWVTFFKERFNCCCLVLKKKRKMVVFKSTIHILYIFIRSHTMWCNVYSTFSVYMYLYLFDRKRQSLFYFLANDKCIKKNKTGHHGLNCERCGWYEGQSLFSPPTRRCLWPAFGARRWPNR